ncbi:MAG: SHOCT domain-containing protein [Actinomycetales bacterium]|nr:SHOCT domain-containing protein [Actinomycetales bacterium]
MKHAAPEPPRRWFGLRRRTRRPEPVVDLRDVGPALADDPESVVSRLARLRDAGLITNAEFEKERRALLKVDEGSG